MSQSEHPSSQCQITIDTGDSVYHRPSGETWVVAYVQNGRLAWLGWPEGEADVNDCELRTAATDEKRIEWLKLMAESRSDAKSRYARWRLGIRE